MGDGGARPEGGPSPRPGGVPASPGTRPWNLAARAARRTSLPFAFPRRWVLRELALRQGGTAVAIGSGLGPLLPWCVRAVGPTGRVLIADFTIEDPGRTRRPAVAGEWRNVEPLLFQPGTFRFPPDIDAVLAMFVAWRPGGGEGLIRDASLALRPGGRLALVDSMDPPPGETRPGSPPLPASLAEGGPRGSRPHCLAALVARHLEVVTVRRHFPWATRTLVGESA